MGDRGEGLHLSPSQTQTTTLSKGVGSEPQQQQQFESEPEREPNQATPKPQSSPTPLEHIMLRLQLLHNRQVLLMKMQNFKKKEVKDSGTEETMCGDSDGECELKAIQRELEKLLLKKEKLQKSGMSSCPTEGHLDAGSAPSKTKTPPGWIYTLPPPPLMHGETRPEPGRPEAETPTGEFLPVGSLGGTPAITRCPSCQEVIYTETHRATGEMVWLLCCLSCLMGCVGGCCLIPFFMERTKNVHHQCPRCQAHIKTHQPL